MNDFLSFYKHLSGKFLNTQELQKCAKKLMGEHRIVKGDLYYQIAEIEFYYYSPHHKDIITYPRNCSQGLWFFHQSGVDLTIQSKESGRDPSFGGILIRSIKKYDKEGYIKTICGPQRCVNELFDYLNAVDNNIELTPMIKEHLFSDSEIDLPTQRYISFDVKKNELENHSTEKEEYQTVIKRKAFLKLDYIIRENKKHVERSINNKDEDWLITSKEDNKDGFFHYLKARYRFYLKNIEWESGYKATPKNMIENGYKFLLK
jgi:hypothetical protein